MDAEITSPLSPVSSYVALWVLFTIIINTIAQSATLTADYTFYLHCSPFYSLIDATWMLLRHITYYLSLKQHDLPLIQIMRVATRTQIDSWENKNPEKMVQDQAKQAHSRTWPRWLFFLTGPLPAAIKLASFTGLPWTKTLGMASLAAFFINEGLAFCIGPPPTIPDIPSIFGCSDIEWEDESKRALRSKIENLKETLKTLEAFQWMVFGLLHIVFLLRAAMEVWENLIWFIKLDNPVSNFAKGASIVTESGLYLSALLIWAFAALRWVVQQCGRPEFLSTYLLPGRIVKITFLCYLYGSLLPGKHDPAWGAFKKFVYSLDSVVLFPYTAFQIFHRLMAWVCKRYPRVGRALFIVKERVREDGEDGEIDEDRWVVMSFFLTNVGTCLLWYLCVYDEKGTVNPEWTVVFGR